MLYRTRQTIRAELERLAALWRRHGTVVVDSEDDSEMDCEQFGAYLSETETAQVGVSASPLSVLEWIAFGKVLYDFWQRNPQFAAALKELAEIIRQRIAELTGGGSVV